MSVSEDRIGSVGATSSPLGESGAFESRNIAPTGAGGGALGRTADRWTPSIRALNNDNHLDALKLIRLLKLHYGDAPPIPGAYASDFWCHSRAPEPGAPELISIVAEEDDRFIAHIALERNPSSSSVHVLLPAIDPEYSTQLFKIIKAFWSSIELQAKRQRWKMIFGYSLGMQPLLQMLSSKCFDAEAVTLLPGPHAAHWSSTSDEFDQSEPLIVLCNVFDRNVAANPSTLYPPPAHLEIIRLLYKGIGLEPMLKVPANFKLEALQEDVGATGRFRRFHEADPTLKGVCGKSNPRLRLYQLRISPSALTDTARALTFIDRLENHRERLGQKLNVQVALDDPQCPYFCGYLEQRGYRFCGIMPSSTGKDYVVFAKLDPRQLEEMALYTAHSQLLRSYLQQGSTLN